MLRVRLQVVVQRVEVAAVVDVGLNDVVVIALDLDVVLLDDVAARHAVVGLRRMDRAVRRRSDHRLHVHARLMHQVLLPHVLAHGTDEIRRGVGGHRRRQLMSILQAGQAVVLIARRQVLVFDVRR